MFMMQKWAESNNLPAFAGTVELTTILLTALQEQSEVIAILSSLATKTMSEPGWIDSHVHDAQMALPKLQQVRELMNSINEKRIAVRNLCIAMANSTSDGNDFSKLA